MRTWFGCEWKYSTICQSVCVCVFELMCGFTIYSRVTTFGAVSVVEQLLSAPWCHLWRNNGPLLNPQTEWEKDIHGTVPFICCIITWALVAIAHPYLCSIIQPRFTQRLSRQYLSTKKITAITGWKEPGWWSTKTKLVWTPAAILEIQIMGVSRDFPCGAA